jgi:hypothetical protein
MNEKKPTKGTLLHLVKMKRDGWRQLQQKKSGCSAATTDGDRSQRREHWWGMELRTTLLKRAQDTIIHLRVYGKIVLLGQKREGGIADGRRRERQRLAAANLSLRWLGKVKVNYCPPLLRAHIYPFSLWSGPSVGWLWPAPNLRLAKAEGASSPHLLFVTFGVSFSFCDLLLLGLLFINAPLRNGKGNKWREYMYVRNNGHYYDDFMTNDAYL